MLPLRDAQGGEPCQEAYGQHQPNAIGNTLQIMTGEKKKAKKKKKSNHLHKNILFPTSFVVGQPGLWKISFATAQCTSVFTSK